MVNPIGLSISGYGTGSTRLSLGTFTAGYPVVISGNQFVSTNSLSLEDFTSKHITLSNTSSDCFLQITGPDTGYSYINFGIESNENIGQIVYNHNNESFIFTVNDSNELVLTSDSLYPSANDGLNLGSPTNRWDHAYLSDATIYGYIYPDTNYGANLGSSSYYWDNLYVKTGYFSNTAGDCSVNILSGDSNSSIINFGKVSDSNIGRISYNHTNNEFTFRVNDNYELVLNSTALYPYDNNGLDLGTSSYRYQSVYVKEKIDIEASVSSARLNIKSASSGFDPSIYFGIAANDSLGRITFDTTNMLFEFYVDSTKELKLSTSSLYPNTSSGLDLGSLSYQWQHIYYSGGLYCTSPNNAIINLRAGSSAHSSIINFGDDSSVNTGIIKYEHSSDLFRFTVSGGEELLLSSSSLYPVVTNGLNLGTSSYYWNNSYVTTTNTKTVIIDGSGPNLYITPTSPLTTAGIYIGANSLGQLLYNESSQLLGIFYNSSSQYGLFLNSGSLYPNPSDITDLGSPTNKWDTVYAVNGSINISDERQKTDINLINDTVLDAWSEISIVFYKWIKEVNNKSYNARFHSGLISQRIKESFAKYGLDAHQYGLFCYDEWPEKIEKYNIKLEDGTEKTIEKIIPAGNSYGIRATECLFVEAAYQRRKNKQIENKLSLIEQRLNELELKMTNNQGAI